jgi:quercetin dioxygenase-like cupin family protein
LENRKIKILEPK